MNNKRCVICPFVCANSTALYRHTHQSHDGDERLKVCCTEERCRYWTKSFTKIRRHFHTKHGMSIRDAYVRVKFKLLAQDDEEPDDLEFDFDMERLNRKVGKAVIDLETRHHVGATGADYVVEQVNEAVNLATGSQKILFKPISTEKRRRAFYKRNFYLVKPKPVLLGSGVRVVRKKAKRFRHTGFFVPFEDQLKALMKLKEFKAFCNATQGPRDPTVYDGIYRTAEGAELKTIYISLSFDEVEICNPIGNSRKIHKQFISLFELLNVDPEFRSALHAKFMLFMCNNKYVRKYYTRLLLADFMRTVKRSQNGLQLDNTNDRYKIEISFCTSDTLAQNLVFGFKETVSKTYRFCRRCWITKDEICRTFDSRNFELRTYQQHADNLAQLQNLTGAELKAYQREVGVVRATPMAVEVPTCTIERALLDPFHLMAEGGVLAIPLQCFLYQIITIDQIISLKELNSIIANWNYWDGDRHDKIPPLDEKLLERGKKLSMKGTCVYLLAQEIPFMLSDFIDENYPYLQNFIRILQLSQTILFAPAWNVDSVAEVREEMSIHHHTFRSLFPDYQLTPKFHFALHFPEQVQIYGPTRYHSTIRYESKYCIIKSQKLKIFINPAKSLAMYHQKYQAQHMVDKNGNANENFYNTNMQIIRESAFVLDRVPHAYQELTAYFNFTKTCLKLSFGSLEYSKGTFLEHSLPYDMNPVFICIQCIFIAENEVFLGVQMYKNVEFFENLCAFKCKDYEHIIVPFSDIKYRLLLPHRQHDGDVYVIRKHSARFQPLV